MKRHRVTSPVWTIHSSRVSGLAGKDVESCRSIWRESVWKDRFLSPFMRYAEEPSRRERENERLVLKIYWGYPREMQPQTQTRCDRYGRLKRECQYPWRRRTTHTNTDKWCQPLRLHTQSQRGQKTLSLITPNWDLIGKCGIACFTF